MPNNRSKTNHTFLLLSILSIALLYQNKHQGNGSSAHDLSQSIEQLQQKFLAGNIEQPIHANELIHQFIQESTHELDEEIHTLKQDLRHEKRKFQQALHKVELTRQHKGARYANQSKQNQNSSLEQLSQVIYESEQTLKSKVSQLKTLKQAEQQISKA